MISQWILFAQNSLRVTAVNNFIDDPKRDLPSVLQRGDVKGRCVTIPPRLLENLKNLQSIIDKPKRKVKITELNIEYFSDFMREIRKTTYAAGLHIMAVRMEELVPQIIEASVIKTT